MCPNGHPVCFLYKELLEDGKAKICCLKCNWESEPVNRHEHIKTLAEKKEN